MGANFKTLPGLLSFVMKNFDNPSALGYKQDGTWRKISTSELGQTVQSLSMGLVDLGLKPGETVGIVADPSPFWMMMDLAILGAGGISVPMFSNISPDNLRYEIQDSAMRFLFVGNHAQYQAMRPFFGSLEKIIALSEESASGEKDTISYASLLKMGDQRISAKPDEYKIRSQEIQESDLATIIYTSGSTGVPKGVELSHTNLVFQVGAAAKRFPLDPATDKILSCLPLAHVFERMVSFFYLSTGTSLYFAEDIKKVGDNLRELSPTIITMVPRLLEKVFAKLQANAEQATGIKKKLAALAMEKARNADTNRKPVFMDKILDSLVYRKMRAAMGGKLRLVISGGSPLDPALAQFFINIGLPLYEGYGLTETSPVIACNFPGHRKIGTVGPVFPGVEVKIADDGEILTRGPHVMRGYHNNPEDTAQVIAKDGWLHTGDMGVVDLEGYLKITGRKKELFKTANGKYVAPVPIEQALSSNKLVDMAMVIAEGKPYTTCLIFPDFENLKALMTERGFGHMQLEDYLNSDDARNLVQATVDAVNSTLNHWEQVQKFRIIKSPVTVESGQLTPTMKIRRHVIWEQYKTSIEDMYKD